MHRSEISSFHWLHGDSEVWKTWSKQSGFRWCDRYLTLLWHSGKFVSMCLLGTWTEGEEDSLRDWKYCDLIVQICKRRRRETFHSFPKAELKVWTNVKKNTNNPFCKLSIWFFSALHFLLWNRITSQRERHWVEQVSGILIGL